VIVDTTRRTIRIVTRAVVRVPDDISERIIDRIMNGFPWGASG